MSRFFIAPIILTIIIVTAYSEDVAVFPVVGVNADRSYIDAFGMLLAKKYEAVSGLTVIDPIKAGRALEPDSNYTTSAQKLGVSEYIELTAIGLFLSRKEKYSYERGDSGTTKMIVIVRDDDDDDDDEDDEDQELLDNSKTVVTAIRKDASGNTIHKAELTLVTYGDIEEASDRFATALYKKITVEEARSLTNITRREGMGHNKLFAEKLTGVKVGGYYPAVKEGTMIGFAAIGFDMRMESQRFFIEFGAGGRIPGADIIDDTKRKYGGMYMEVGGSYIFNPASPLGVYAGLGVIPFLNFFHEMEMGVAPYLQSGITFPRNSKVRFFIDVRIAQNVLPITTETNTFSSLFYDESSVVKVCRPFEIGMNMGIGW
ncbi:MAG: hypothetical protein JW913_14325 [Chitinispirillaceae bacterium]|nr:hypothetical protein [Chitinispirillaceae bacterium]